MSRNARKERVRLTPFRDSTTQYNSPQYTAVLRILRRTARSAADTVERTAAQHWSKGCGAWRMRNTMCPTSVVFQMRDSANAWTLRSNAVMQTNFGFTCIATA